MQLSPLSAAIPTFGSATLEDLDFSKAKDGARIGGDSKRQFVRFYKKIVATVVKALDGTARVDEKEREFVQIVTPGDTNNVDDFAQDYHKREHWQSYRAFREGRTAPMGMPIEEASFISPEVATELRYLHVHTIEQLADAADYLCGQIPNGWDMREFARAMCKANAKNQNLNEINVLKAELNEAKSTLEKLKGLVGSEGQLLVKTLKDEPAERKAELSAARRNKTLANIEGTEV